MKKKAKIGTVLCCSTALVSILGGYLLTKNTNLFKWGDNATNTEIKVDNIPTSELETSQTVENMAVALLNKQDNQDGSTSYTYTFTITPTNSTRKDISGILSFVDGTEGVTNFLEFEIDNTNSQFTITKKADFNHQAQLELSCNANPSVRATITLDCKQYFQGFNNVTEKSYTQLMTSSQPVGVASIKSDGAAAIGANNFSNVYTIATNANYRVEKVTPTLIGYITGDDIDNMTDAGLSIDNTWKISKIDLSKNLTLNIFNDAIYNDTAKMTGTTALELSQRAYFGVAYDLDIMYNTANHIHNMTAHITAVASTNNLDFGIPVTLSVESNAITFENIETTMRFAFTNNNGVVTYIDPQDANETGWLSTGLRSFYKGYINVEITHTLDGVTLDGPTLLYPQNEGKGFYTGDSSSEFYIVFNPGGHENIRWINQKVGYTNNLAAISNYASSTY